MRVAVHADDPITLAGLTTLLSGTPDLETVHADRTLDADVLVVAPRQVDVDLLARRQLSAAGDAVPLVLIASEIADAQFVAVARTCRLAALLPRSAVTGEYLVRAITAVADGGGILPSNLSGALLRQFRQLSEEVRRGRSETDRLTAREVRVLRLAADGLDTRSIATELAYSERTVKNTVRDVTRRLGLRNRTHAVVFAIRSGLI
ncbi:response regulator transcription factor [Micromonospora matsumotoense]|uniref:helix-turn-helix transcriptional regulator n=1 Tax=Micromonospora matsumotoense TaxID=121616 RepID=UPI0033DEA918